MKKHLIKLICSLSITLSANAKICDQESEIKKLDKLKEIHKEFLDNGLHIHGINSLRNPVFRPYITGVANLGKDCATIPLYKEISKTLTKMGYPSEYLDYMLSYLQTNLGIRKYQIGNDWNRQFLTDSSPMPVKRLLPSILITGREKINTERRLQLEYPGTAFYLGKIRGEHLVATASHVFNNDKNKFDKKLCETNLFHFPSGGKFSLRGKRLIGAWINIDFAICAIDIPSDKEEILKDKIRPISINWNAIGEPGQMLTTIGYGSYKNTKKGKPLFENSENCKVVFGDTERRYRDEKQSIAIGCDASPGDSGSAIVDRESGELAGLIWGVKKVKAPYSFQDLLELKETNPDIVWDELVMAISTQTIKEALIQSLGNTNSSIDKETVRKLLNN